MDFGLGPFTWRTAFAGYARPVPWGNADIAGAPDGHHHWWWEHTRPLSPYMSIPAAEFLSEGNTFSCCDPRRHQPLLPCAS